MLPCGGHTGRAAHIRSTACQTSCEQLAGSVVTYEMSEQWGGKPHRVSNLTSSKGDLRTGRPHVPRPDTCTACCTLLVEIVHLRTGLKLRAECACLGFRLPILCGLAT